MLLVADWISRVLAHPGDVEMTDRVREEVEALCRRFPLYPGRWDD
jgi:glycine hydroxymethyltransferase